MESKGKRNDQFVVFFTSLRRNSQLLTHQRYIVKNCLARHRGNNRNKITAEKKLKKNKKKLTKMKENRKKGYKKG